VHGREPSGCDRRPLGLLELVGLADEASEVTG
jgi:hypothetical protein